MSPDQKELFISRFQRVKLSRLMAYILRHNPAKFGINLDRYGFSKLPDFLSAVRLVHPWVEMTHVLDIVERSTKRRFEIVEDKIRATYGHSIEVEPLAKPIQPPEFLYHGTSPEALEEIKRGGLKPMRRQWVHLSISKEDALEVGRRKAQTPTILRIKADLAHKNGVNFRREGDVFLVKAIPPEFIDFP
ncbi:MAG: RNA 2'-phosphotransferase [bacterium]|nr:RNA 2'-phosphotransferase [bacterium]